MPKLRNAKTISKRIRVTKKKKMFTMAAGQSHFRSRHSGSSKMSKRKYNPVDKTNVRNIKRAVPYM